MVKPIVQPSTLYSFRHPNRRRVQTDCSGPSLTQQEFAVEADINRIVDKHVKSGLPFPTGGQFADVSNVPDFNQAMDTVVKAQEAWMQLPAKVRRHFGDKAENFLSALHDKERHPELERLGIIKKPVEAPASSANGGTGGVAPGSKGEAPANAGGAKPGTVST